MKEIAGGEIRVLALSIHLPRAGNNRERNIREIHDLLNIRRKPLLLLCHIAVSFQSRRFTRLPVVLPFSVSRLESVDLLLLVLVIIIDRVNRIVIEIKVRRHRMQLAAGIAPVCRAIPALQFVTEHQQKRQRILFHL